MGYKERQLNRALEKETITTGVGPDVCYLMDSIDELVILARSDGTIMKINKAVKDILGYSDNDLQGCSITNLHPDGQKVLAENRLKALQISGCENYIVDFLSLSGTRHSMLCTLSSAYCRGEVVIIMISRILKENDTLVPRKFNHISVLYIDDCHISHGIVKSIMCQQGWSMMSAMSGIEGIDKFIREKFDLVISDIEMPVIDGIQVAQFIREYEKYRESKIPLIALTSSPISEENIIKCGFDELIQKPFSAVSLVRTIKHHVNHSRLCRNLLSAKYL